MGEGQRAVPVGWGRKSMNWFHRRIKGTWGTWCRLPAECGQSYLHWWVVVQSVVSAEACRVGRCIPSPKHSLCFSAPACTQWPCGTQLHLLPSDFCQISGASGTAQPAKPLSAPWLVFDSPGPLANILPLWAGRMSGGRGSHRAPHRLSEENKL